jgi:MoaA/NifB/PqqE/SkfB family radical SAM enzyme
MRTAPDRPNARPAGPERDRARDRRYESIASVNQALRLVRSLVPSGSFRAMARFLGYLFATRVRRRRVPFYLSFAVTNRCVCRCVHCYAFGHLTEARPELTTDDCRAVLDAARALGVFLVIFTGGEPLLRPDLFELVRYARRLGFLTRLNTNAWLLDGATVARLKRAGLQQCAVSLDDADPDVHDRLRGKPGAQRRALAAFGLLRRAGIYSLVNSYVSRRHLAAGVEKTMALARRHGADSFLVFPAEASGRWERESREILSPAEVEALRPLQDLRYFHLEQSSARTNCDAYKSFVIYVSAEGDITPCPFVPYVLANVRDRTLGETWRAWSEDMDLERRGICPVNDPAGREALRRRVALKAKRLAEARR